MKFHSLFNDLLAEINKVRSLLFVRTVSSAQRLKTCTGKKILLSDNWRTNEWFYHPIRLMLQRLNLEGAIIALIEIRGNISFVYLQTYNASRNCSNVIILQVKHLYWAETKVLRSFHDRMINRLKSRIKLNIFIRNSFIPSRIIHCRNSIRTLNVEIFLLYHLQFFFTILLYK